MCKEVSFIISESESLVLTAHNVNIDVATNPKL